MLCYNVVIKQKTAYEMRIIDWSADVCSSDLQHWQKGAELIALDQIGWIGDDGAARHALWAPDMVAANGRHHLYFSVGPHNPTPNRLRVDRKSVVSGQSVSVRVDLGGRPIIKITTNDTYMWLSSPYKTKTHQT